MTIDTILVPKGAEYQAVCRGLQGISPQPLVLSLPIGIIPVTTYLQQWQKNHIMPEKVLLVGLCGSLLPNYQVGDLVFYEKCLYYDEKFQWQTKNCDRPLTTQLRQRLERKVSLVTSVTSDHTISSAKEKQQLGRSSQAAVVDMEGFAVLTSLPTRVAMLRIVSDDCIQDLPDLTGAISTEGKLLPLPLTIAMLSQPLAATRLIRGSLKGLQALQKAIASLFL